jgi:hypothetical protein
MGRRTDSRSTHRKSEKQCRQCSVSGCLRLHSFKRCISRRWISLIGKDERRCWVSIGRLRAIGFWMEARGFSRGPHRA